MVPMAPSQRPGRSARAALNACGMRLPQRGEHARDDLVDAEPGRVHRDVGARVVGFARAVQRLDLRGRALEHGAAADALRAREQLGQIAAQPHDSAERAQRLDAVVAARQPAAGGDHVAGLEGERGERLALETAEGVLAVVTEDVGDRAAVARDDHVVGLDEASAEAAREQAPADRLPRPHEPHDDDVVARHATHPITVDARLQRTSVRYSLAHPATRGGAGGRVRAIMYWTAVT